MSTALSWFVCMSLCFCAGCVVEPLPVVRLFPRGENVVWAQGRGVMAQSRNGLRVAMAFDRNVEGQLAFRVEVANDAHEPVLVEPHRFVGSYCKRLPRDVASFARLCPQRLRFENPEVHALEAELAQSREDAAHATAELNQGGMLLLAAVADVVASSDGDHGNATDRVWYSMQREEDRSARATQRNESSLNYWTTSVLRRTTLRAGESVAGMALVGGRPGAPIVVVSIKVGTMEFRFPFRQITRHP